MSVTLHVDLQHFTYADHDLASVKMIVKMITKMTGVMAFIACRSDYHTGEATFKIDEKSLKAWERNNLP